MSIIYRFNFSEKISHRILCFSKMYQYEERTFYKEKWDLWCEENNDLILTETERLKQLGYEGDVLDKMYKASRYYFRKKKMEKNIPKKREQYISLSKQILQSIDFYII
jgi:endo-alpha-1,4-polygalactosaminidase (GH114 family)